MKTALLPLTSGEHALVDAEDLPKLHGYTWSRSGGRKLQYVRGSRGLGKRGHTERVYLHRFLVGALKGQMVDHKNRDELDNRKVNLRFVTPEQSVENIGLSRHNRSGYRGVYWHSAARKWAVQIHRGNQRIYLGLYADLQEAAQAALDARLRMMTHSDGR